VSPGLVTKRGGAALTKARVWRGLFFSVHHLGKKILAGNNCPPRTSFFSPYLSFPLSLLSSRPATAEEKKKKGTPFGRIRIMVETGSSPTTLSHYSRNEEKRGKGKEGPPSTGEGATWHAILSRLAFAPGGEVIKGKKRKGAFNFQAGLHPL